VLSRHKVPAAIHFVDNLPVASTGKLLRNYA
jgi:acyl-coenzyme A synthetase/AMP-(fatty) acid ligase